MIGARVVIGVTYHGVGDVRPEQMFGTIESVDAVTGFKFILDGSRRGEAYRLPPQIDVFKPARPGEYRLKATDEIVIDPDYTTAWTFAKPAH